MIKSGLLYSTGGVLFFFILYPLGVLLFRAFFSAERGSHFFIQILSQRNTWEALGNTLMLGAIATGIATVVGSSLAFLVVRTDFPAKKLIDIGAKFAFITPPYLIALAWLQLLGRGGYVSRILKILFGVSEYNVQYYSVWGAAVILSVHLFPLIYLALRNALTQIDPNMEKAALMSGATRWKSFVTVTLPFCIPALSASALLVFSRIIANFEVPALLCLPVQKDVLTTHIFSALNNLDLNGAVAHSFILVFISCTLFLSQNYFIKESYGVAESTPDLQKTVFKLGRKKWLISCLVFVCIGVICLFPVVTMLISSFLKRWGLPLRPEYFTLGNYKYLLIESHRAHRAFLNSLFYGALAAAGAGMISCIIALLEHLGKRKSSRVFEVIASWPIAFPNIVLALAAILAYNRSPFELYGTVWVIIVTYMVLFTPVMLKQTRPLIENHDSSLIAASRVCGATILRSFFTVTFPALVPGLKAGFMIGFLIAFREIPISLLLYSKGQESVGVLLFGMQSESYGLEMTSALAVLVIFFLIAGNLVIHCLKKKERNFNEEINNKSIK